MKEAYVRKLMAFNYSKGWLASHPDVLTELVRQSLAHKRPPAGITAQAMGVGTFDVAAQLPRLAVPVLVVHGDEDALIPLECGRSIAAKIPGSKLYVLPGVGHVFWNESSVCQDVVRAFFAAQDYLCGATAELAALRAKL